MAKTKITEMERMQIMGLLLLAKDHNEKLAEIHNAVLSITEDADDIGHCSDAVYSDFSADELLRKLKITVST